MVAYFVTIFAWAICLGVTARYALAFYAFSQLSAYDQQRARITISKFADLMWLLSIAWLVAYYTS